MTPAVQRALRYNVTGPVSDGVLPVSLYVMLERQRQVKVVYSDGSFVRYKCWACAMKTRRYELHDMPPTRVLVPLSF
jgi:hypothetical protein